MALFAEGERESDPWTDPEHVGMEVRPVLVFMSCMCCQRVHARPVALFKLP
jgi:hypothetical protein